MNYSSMHNLHMEPKDLLLKLMERDGYNPNSLAAKFDSKSIQSQVFRFLSGKTREPRRSTLVPIAEFFKINVEAFYNPSMAQEVMDEMKDAKDNVIEIGSSNNRQKNKPDEIVLSQFNSGGSMGSGLLLRDQPGVIQSWRVNAEWIQKNIKSHTGAANLCIVTGFGDSMKGMFNSGDPLVVDKGVNSVEGDAVYFFRVDDEGFIKRLQRIPGEGIRVLSENKKYESWTIKPDMNFEVFGRVVKAWQGEDF